MPLTRHLYELDEVVSALQTCLRNGWPRSPFWTWELVVSQETNTALSTLRDCWLRYGGGFDPALMQLRPTDDPADQTWLLLTQRVSRAIKLARGTHAAEFLSRTAALPVRPDVTPLPKKASAANRRATRAAAFVAELTDEEIPSAEATEWWISLDAACRQGSRTNAIWLLQAALQRISLDGIWTAIRHAARGGAPVAALEAAVATELHPRQQILAQTNALLLLCARGDLERTAMTQEPPAAELQSSFWQTEWSRWNSAVGRRATRIYAIPQDALHRETTRGAMSRRFTNIGDVREPQLVLLEGCTFWRSAAAAAGIVEDEETGAVLFPDDETLEAFMDEHFPDDIPDEWSRADQEKSHGRGGAETAPPSPAPLQIREEPVSQRVWRMAIGCRAAKKLTVPTWRGARC